MEPNDLFLKVKITAYFAVNANKIEIKGKQSFLDGKMISPVLDYFYEEERPDGTYAYKKIPAKVKPIYMTEIIDSEELISYKKFLKENPDFGNSTPEQIQESLDRGGRLIFIGK